jgi:uracil-DNA glycosylase
MEEAILNDWKDILKNEFSKEYFKNLKIFVDNEYQKKICFPKKNEIFNALNYCSFKDVKVVIIGQDPYHNFGQANGLCFSVNKGIELPPSLKNIFKELKSDIGIKTHNDGDLSSWAKQGVLLLNTVLTVEAHKACSHKNKGWELFTDTIIKTISNSNNNIIFLLWGGFAKSKIKLIDSKKHHILTSGHPSPLSANRGYWFGNKHFSKTNLLLDMIGEKPIIW